MIKSLAVIAATLAAMGAAPAFAQSPDNAATTVSPVTVPGQRLERTDTPDQMQRGRHVNPNDRVCRSITATGSRLGSRRQCRTRAEWDALAADSRDTTDSIQRQTRVPGG